MNALIDELISVLENCCADDEEISHCLDDFADNHCRHIVISSGETRYAVIFKRDNFVLKIPRYGYCKEDYCQAEIRAYESAKKFRVERILLPIELYHTTSTGIAIYKQPIPVMVSIIMVMIPISLAATLPATNPLLIKSPVSAVMADVSAVTGWRECFSCTARSFAAPLKRGLWKIM